MAVRVGGHARSRESGQKAYATFKAQAEAHHWQQLVRAFAGESICSTDYRRMHLMILTKRIEHLLTGLAAILLTRLVDSPLA